MSISSIYLKQRHANLLLMLEKTRHLGKAAEALYISQPAASKALAQLELEVGHSLFHRSGSGMLPTALGEIVINHAKNIVGAATRLSSEIDALSNQRRHLLRIGILPSSSLHISPRLIAGLLTKDANLDISIQEGLLHDLINALHAHELDCVIGRVSSRENSEKIKGIFLYKDQTCIVCGSQNTLAFKENVSLADLMSFFWILPLRGSVLDDRVKDMFERFELPMPAKYVQSNAVLTNVMLLKNNPWVAVLPRVLAEHFEQQGAITILPIDTEINFGNIQVMIRKEESISPPLALAIDLLKSFTSN